MGSTEAPSRSGVAGKRPGSDIALGIFVHSSGSDYSTIDDFISRLGRTPAIIQGFFGWKDAGGSYIPFPRTFVDYVTSRGATAMITWQPGQASANNQVNGQVGGGTVNRARLQQPEFALAALASGAHDTYVRQWAEAAKAFQRTIYVRLMHEPNDFSYPWALGVNGNTSPAAYVIAFRHIVSIFHQVGATNVQFVWCVGANPRNSPLQALFPGDQYVQWVSIDGYNRLKNQPGWETISDIFSQAYLNIVSFSRRPVMIAETATVEEPGNPAAKPSWITDGFLNLIPQDFPRVKAVLYFDSPGRGFTYSLDSSTQSFAAFKEVADNREYRASAPTQPLSY